MVRFVITVVLGAVFWAAVAPNPAAASRCIAYAYRAPSIIPVAFRLPVAASAGDVHIAYVSHSTFRVRTPAGVVIATDYAGWAGEGPVPAVATMNHAHETHYTDFPDPAIKHVLKGWNPKGGAAVHRLMVSDVLIRNVATHIRGWDGLGEHFGNSIFIFEVADLCIGHLGHLHHKPAPAQMAQIGRLDVVFVPVDGSYTLDLASMIGVMKELKASLVIPMHYFDGSSLKTFLAGMRKHFRIEVSKVPATVISRATLPSRPTVLVLPGNGIYYPGDNP